MGIEDYRHLSTTLRLFSSHPFLCCPYIIRYLKSLGAVDIVPPSGLSGSRRHLDVWNPNLSETSAWFLGTSPFTMLFRVSPGFSCVFFCPQAQRDSLELGLQEVRLL